MATAAPTKSRSKKAATPAAQGNMADAQTGNLVGRVAQVIGAVVDVAFEGELPPISPRSKPTMAATALSSKSPSISVRMWFEPSPWIRPTA